ncbi:hypothetical protein [Bacillus sp. SRB3LM]
MMGEQKNHREERVTISVEELVLKKDFVLIIVKIMVALLFILLLYSK